MRRERVLIAASLGAVLALVGSAAWANVALTQLSSDPYTNTSSQHRTEVEPDTFSFGNTIVSAFQVGRFSTGGSSNIGWATSTDGGTTWTNGFLPGITKIVSPSNPYDRVSDPSVAFDAKHGEWLIASLAIKTPGGSVNGAAVIVNRSTDGVTWSNPVVVASATGAQNLDKDWVVCDSTTTSTFYGNCYVEFDDNGAGDLILMSTSHDGGATWGAALPTANAATGLGGQPLVQPSGTVIVPIDNASESSVLAFTSTDGGTSWGPTVLVSTIRSHREAGNLRSGPLPSAEIDQAGKVYVVWGDCRFRTNCSANDIVMSTSSDGVVWSAATRIPIDSTTSGVDHFIPGIAVDKSTSGTTAHLALTYYFYPVSACTSSTCNLDVGFIASTNGGTSWSAATQLAGSMKLSWLANTTQGRMVGDYISTSFNSSGLAHGVFATASAPSLGKFNENMSTNAAGLAAHAAATGAESMTVTDPVLSTASDHPDLTEPATRR